MKKVIWPGIVSGIVMLAVAWVFGWLFHYIFPSVMAEYSNETIFRPWSDPLMSVYFIYPFVLGIILAAFWTRIKNMFKGTTARRGTHFGFFYWLITIPGMIISYSSFQVSLLMVIGWSISILIQGILGGMTIAKMNK